MFFKGKTLKYRWNFHDFLQCCFRWINFVIIQIACIIAQRGVYWWHLRTVMKTSGHLGKYRKTVYFRVSLFPRVDFERAVWENRRNVFVWSDGEDPNDYSGKIIECSWLPEEKKWEYMRVRTDKDTPNAIRTYRKVSYKNVRVLILMTEHYNENIWCIGDGQH